MAQLSCANTEQTVGSEISTCPNLGTSVCTGCLLVQYCSKTCQVAHWKVHKLDCKSPLAKPEWKPAWHLEQRQPDFIGDNPAPQARHGQRKYLWGNVPAVDVLKHAQNEAKDLPQELHLLFAASGDMRNVAKSLIGLPKAFSGSCDAVINDRDFDIVARNAIMLLTTLSFDPAEAAPIMLHIWYSALIPQRILRSLKEKLLPLITDVCTKIHNKPNTSLQSKTWKFGSRSLRLVLKKAEWDRLPSYLEIPEGLSAVEARTVMTATTLAPHRKDYVERSFYARPPAWRVCVTKFREDGILLPFGSSRNEFDTPNPTFFQSREFWPMMDSADPLEGWPIDEVIRKVLPAKNDIYGSLYIYVLEVLQNFCNRLEDLQVLFQLFQLDALELPNAIRPNMWRDYFDRIEVSNISDRGYIGPLKTLATFGPLLKRKSDNPHATLLALFLNAVHEVATPQDRIKALKSEADQARKYLPLTKSMLAKVQGYDADFMKFNDARIMFRDLDTLFGRFEKAHEFEEVSKIMRLTKKTKNTIIEKWPLRLKKGATQVEFDNLLASGHMGCERYVEWEVAE